MKKTTMYLDEEMLKQAKKAVGVSTDTEAVRLGLQALIRHDAYQRMRAFRGSEPDALDYEVPRRREEPARKRKAS
jgi:Arc/MetJ family transcription regulator